MSKLIGLPDEAYQALVDAANKRHETPEQLLTALARALSESAGAVYYSIDEMFDALGAYVATSDATKDSHPDAGQ